MYWISIDKENQINLKVITNYPNHLKNEIYSMKDSLGASSQTVLDHESLARCRNAAENFNADFCYSLLHMVSISQYWKLTWTLTMFVCAVNHSRQHSIQNEHDSQAGWCHCVQQHMTILGLNLLKIEWYQCCSARYYRRPACPHPLPKMTYITYSDIIPFGFQWILNKHRWFGVYCLSRCALFENIPW